MDYLDTCYFDYFARLILDLIKIRWKTLYEVDKK